MDTHLPRNERPYAQAMLFFSSTLRPQRLLGDVASHGDGDILSRYRPWLLPSLYLSAVHQIKSNSIWCVDSYFQPKLLSLRGCGLIGHPDTRSKGYDLRPTTDEAGNTCQRWATELPPHKMSPINQGFAMCCLRKRLFQIDGLLSIHVMES